MKLKQKLDKYFNWIDELYILEDKSRIFIIDISINFLTVLFLGIFIFVGSPLLFTFSLILKPIQLLANLYYKLTEGKRLDKQLIKNNELIKNSIQKYGEVLLYTDGLLKLNFESIKNPSDNLEKFIYDFFTSYNQLFSTKYLDGAHQCDYDRRRSLGDIFRICKFYYPNCTIGEVLQILIQLCIDKKISGNRCSQISKYVFFVRDSHDNNNFTNDVTEYLPNFGLKRIIQAYKPDYKFT